MAKTKQTSKGAKAATANKTGNLTNYNSKKKREAAAVKIGRHLSSKM